MHNEALTPKAADSGFSRKVMPTGALATVSPDPQRRGAAPDTGTVDDVAKARMIGASQSSNAAADHSRASLALSRARTSAVFLTQLIACSRRLPAYRERRRAAPDEAARAYDAAATAHRRPARVISDF